MSLQIGWNYFSFKEVYLKSESFSDSFNGLRIALLCDLHLDKHVSVLYLERLVEKINQQKVDLVLFGGDTLRAKAHEIKEQIATFANLSAKAYFVSGNHDLFLGLDELENVMQEQGVIQLDNRVETLYIGDTWFQLVGLSDRFSFLKGIKRPIKELFSKLDPNMPTILLTHQPKDIEYTDGYRVDFQLSGHTHGGQIYPLTFLVKLFQPYFSGIYTYKKTKLYVSRGVGYWGLNIRYKAQSEITILTLY